MVGAWECWTGDITLLTAENGSSRSISADLPISYPFHVKSIGRHVSPVIPEVSRRCDVTPQVETVTYRVYRVLSQQVCVCVRQTLGA